MSIFICIILYGLIGIIRVGYDFIQPPHNQPLYIYEKRWSLIILFTFLWPVLMYEDFYDFWQYFKKVDTSTTKNANKEEPTGISRLSFIEKKLKDKNEKEKKN